MLVVVLVLVLVLVVLRLTGGNRQHEGSAWYWALVAVLLGVGAIGVFSIGMPFLLVGLMLAAVEPYRKRPAAFWPAIIAVLALIGGYILVAPGLCTSTGVATSTSPLATSSQKAGSGATTCTNLLGIDYSGSGTYNPSLVPALVAGIVAAAIFGCLSRLWLCKRRP